MNPLPRVSIMGVTHYQAPHDPILGRHTMCGINKLVSATPTIDEITCRTCKVLIHHVNNHIKENIHENSF